MYASSTLELQPAVLSAAPLQALKRFIESKAVFAACILAFLVYCWLPKDMADPDIWWHLRDAGLQLANHTWLTHDVFSYSAAGAPWMNHEWLAELPFYLGWHLLGPQGVLLVALLVTECVLILQFYLAYRLSQNTVIALATSALATMFATVSFGPRTLLFGWLCLMVELILLDLYRKNELSDRATSFAFPALFVLWVNLHGSWLIGMILLAGFLICESVPPISALYAVVEWPARSPRVLLRAAAMSFAALFANPYGWRLVLYPFDLAFKQKLNIANVEEWRALDFHTPRAKVFLLCLIALFVIQLLRKSKWALYELMFVVAGIYGAFLYSRFLFLGGLLLCPVLARQIAQVIGARMQQPARANGWFHAGVVLALVPFMVLRFPSAGTMRDRETLYPVQALTYLQDFHPEGKVFNEYLWGGYLEWHVGHLPVFVDSRVDIFERNGTLKDYLDIVRLKDAEPLLQKHGIRYVLFERETPLVKLLEASREWNVKYQDATTVLLERSARS